MSDLRPVASRICSAMLHSLRHAQKMAGRELSQSEALSYLLSRRSSFMKNREYFHHYGDKGDDRDRYAEKCEFVASKWNVFDEERQAAYSEKQALRGSRSRRVFCSDVRPFLTVRGMNSKLAEQFGVSEQTITNTKTLCRRLDEKIQAGKSLSASEHYAYERSAR